MSLIKNGIFVMLTLLCATSVYAEPDAAELLRASERHSQAVQLFRAGEYDQAVEIANEVASTTERLYGPEHTYTAASINNLALFIRTMGRYAEAEPLFKRALAIYEKVLGSEHPNVAMALNNLASLYEITERYAEAEPLYKRALTIDEKALGPDHSDTAIDINNLAGLYKSTNRYAEAESLSKRALAIFEKVHGTEHPLVATTLNNLGLLYMDTGRFAEAEPLLVRALAVNEKTLGQNHPEVVPSIVNLARLYEITGRYANADMLYEHAWFRVESVFGPDHPELVKHLHSLAKMYVTTGRFAEAEPLYKRNLTIVEKAFGPDHPETALCLNNLALFYTDTNRYAEAEPLYKRALSILEKVHGTEHPDALMTYNNLGVMYMKTGRYAEAEPLLKRNLAISEKTEAEHANVHYRLIYATKLTNLGMLYFFTGRYAESEPLITRGLFITTSAGGNPDSLQLSQGYYSMLLEKMNNPEAAIFFGKQEINTIQGMRQNVARMGQEYLQALTIKVETSYKRLANLLIEQGRLAEAQQVLAMLKEEEYFQYIRRDNNAASKLGTTAGMIPPEIPWDGEYKKLLEEDTRNNREMFSLREIEKKGMLRETEKVRLKELESISRQQGIAFNDFLTRLLARLKQDIRTQTKVTGGAVFTVNQEITATLQKALNTLGNGAVLLQYLISNDKVHIILTTPDRQVTKQSPILAAELNQKLFAFRDLLKQPKLDPRPMGKEMYDILISPMAQELREVKAQTLMLSLEGALRYIPFAALYDGSRYLAEEYRTVMYADAARQTITLPVRPDWTVAALGVSQKVHPEFSSLPAVPAELASIVRNGKYGVLPGETYLDKAFTEATLLQAASRNPVLHVASHFKFSTGTEKDSFLLLGDGSTYTLDKVKNGTAFSSAELLTLSACETALGTTGTGREIEGFGALAMNSGTKAVIATLWPIADESTAQFMQQFYSQREGKKLLKVEALRLAQLALMNGTAESTETSDIDRANIGQKAVQQTAGAKRYRTDPKKPFAHPYFWAPFVLMGNWK